MTVHRAAVLALPLALTTALAAPAAATAPPPAPADGRVAAPQVPVLAGEAAAPTAVLEEGAGPDGASRLAPRATFRVSYSGFSPAAQAAFQRAVNAWAGQVSSPVPITVRATFRPLGPGVLGSAGPTYLFPSGGAYYVDAIANKRAGRQLDPAPDIVANFSSGFSNWHFGSGPAPRGTYDFQTVVMHELGHGLGFLGAGTVRDGRGSVRLNGLPVSYDRSTENGSGKALLSYPDRSTALAGQLTGGQVFFDSPRVRSANGGRPARLYAPSRFQPGSSYSHLDEATFRAGNRNSLMTPRIGAGETVRTPGPVTRAIFDTIGW